jgi:hypothetical protein
VPEQGEGARFAVKWSSPEAVDSVANVPVMMAWVRPTGGGKIAMSVIGRGTAIEKRVPTMGSLGRSLGKITRSAAVQAAPVICTPAVTKVIAALFVTTNETLVPCDVVPCQFPVKGLLSSSPPEQPWHRAISRRVNMKIIPLWPKYCHIDTPF